jgi:hypothetical protein
VDELLTIPRPTMRARGPEIVPAIVIGAIVGVLFVVAAITVRLPDTVSFSVQNPTQWRAEVSIRSASGTSWTDIGAVGRDSELEFLQVPDQGSNWVVRYSYAGVTEEFQVTRDDLSASDWVLQVPQAFADRLEGDGVAATTGSTSGQ